VVGGGQRFLTWPTGCEPLRILCTDAVPPSFTCTSEQRLNTPDGASANPAPSPAWRFQPAVDIPELAWYKS
jgi:hypothetical protein